VGDAVKKLVEKRNAKPNLVEDENLKKERQKVEKNKYIFLFANEID